MDRSLPSCGLGPGLGHQACSAEAATTEVHLLHPPGVWTPSSWALLGVAPAHLWAEGRWGGPRRQNQGEGPYPPQCFSFPRCSTHSVPPGSSPGCSRGAPAQLQTLPFLTLGPAVEGGGLTPGLAWGWRGRQETAGVAGAPRRCPGKGLSHGRFGTCPALECHTEKEAGRTAWRGLRSLLVAAKSNLSVH